MQRARLRLDLRDAAGALNDAISATRIQPQLVGAWAIRGEARFLLGEAQASLQAWARAFKLARNRVRPGWLILRGRAWRAVGQLKRALKDLDLAVSSPGATDPWFHRGLTRILAGDRQGGAQDLETSVQKRRSGAALVWLGALGKVTETLKKVAGRRDWTGALAKFLTGAASAKALLSAAQQSPQQGRMQRLAEAHCMIGLRLEARADKANASRHYQACLATRATHTVVWQWLTDRVRVLQLLRARARQRPPTPKPPTPRPPSPTPKPGDSKEPY